MTRLEEIAQRLRERAKHLQFIDPETSALLIKAYAYLLEAVASARREALLECLEVARTHNAHSYCDECSIGTDIATAIRALIERKG